jgi:hypothetical protein
MALPNKVNKITGVIVINVILADMRLSNKQFNRTGNKMVKPTNADKQCSNINAQDLAES